MLNRPRIKGLDSLRGIAAGTVVIAHACDILIKGHSFDEYTPLYLFRAAHESVIFFFLLSGYVLTYQIQNRNYFNYLEFITLRFFRIYIPYFIIIIFTFILFIIFHGNVDSAGLVWCKKLSFNALINHLTLIGNFNTNDYNPVIWSLVHEMRVAIIFPTLLFIISFKWPNALLVAILLSLTAGIGITYGFNPSNGYNNSYLYTIHYLSLFVLGALIAKHNDILNSWYRKVTYKTRMFLLLLSLLVFNYSRMLFLIPHRFKLYQAAVFNEIIADWLTAFAAGYFIISVIQIVAKKNWLLQRMPMALGKISYSLYLIHLPVILICFIIFSNFSKITIIAIAIFIAIILSTFANKYIEKPSSDLGKIIVDSKKADAALNQHNKLPL
jgi:peptidoglycan/LPS O-acetylase OafA/YrhL